MTQPESPTERMEDKYWLGKFSMTNTAQEKLNLEDVLCALKRHGDNNPGSYENDNGYFLISGNQDRNQNTFWIMSEPAKKSVMVLMPGDL